MLHVRIVNGELVEVGPLPASARRLDTLEQVDGLDGPNAKWAAATGWFPIDSLTLDGLTPEQRETIQSVIVEAVEKQGRRQAAVQAGRVAANTAKNYFQAWLTAYSSLPVEGSPTAGAEWAALTTAEKAEALRDGVSGSLIWGVKVANALLLIVDVLQDLIADTDLEPPGS